MSEKLWEAYSAAVRASFVYKKLYSITFPCIHHVWCFRYHVPRSWLKPSGNVLVLFEQAGGDPTKLSFATREVQSICSRVSESHPIPVEMWTADEETRKSAGPTLSLGCPHPQQVISKINFASFGTPHGSCGSFSHGRCSSKRALSIINKVLLIYFVTNYADIF